MNRASIANALRPSPRRLPHNKLGPVLRLLTGCHKAPGTDERCFRPLVPGMPGSAETERRKPNLQSDTITKLRELAHDLSNSIETVMQASYLLGQATLDESAQKWLQLIDKAVQDAARINREIREILRSQSE